MYIAAEEKISGAAFLVLEQEDIKHLVKPLGTFKLLQDLQSELNESKVRIL